MTLGAIWSARDRVAGVEVSALVLNGPALGALTTGGVLRESGIVSALPHPCFVPVIAHGINAGRSFFAMEPIGGRALAEFLGEDGPLTPARAVALFLPVCDALEMLHRKELLHRHLNLTDIFLSASGALRLPCPGVDLAGSFFRAPSGADSSEDEGETNAATSKLSPEGAFALVSADEFLAPEQLFAAATPDVRADVYALCAVIHSMVTGVSPPSQRTGATRPLTGRSLPDTAFCSGADGLQRLLARGLSLDPEARWPTMKSLGLALAEWAAEHGVARDALGTLTTDRLQRQPNRPATGSSGRWSPPAKSPSSTIRPPPPTPHPTPANDASPPSSEASPTRDTPLPTVRDAPRLPVVIPTEPAKPAPSNQLIPLVLGLLIAGITLGVMLHFAIR
jgi:serine/threonine-protein kinase